MVIICLFTVNQLGAATIMYTIIGILALPFYITGMPGFLPKVPIMIVDGILLDVVYSFLKNNKLVSSTIIGALRTFYIGATLLGIGLLVNMPAAEHSARLFLSPIGIVGSFIVGAFGGYLGYLIYQKIKNTAVVKRIQAGQ